MAGSTECTFYANELGLAGGVKIQDAECTEQVQQSRARISASGSAHAEGEESALVSYQQRHVSAESDVIKLQLKTAETDVTDVTELQLKTAEVA